ncbi:PTS-dependent dihydroxyacetone kinase, ADP-binding subunit dhaL [Raoultella terrigena]|uniref:PTS-dependent dihydroxyacetone kinase, ADP-binding subunit dhaL n=1 Tax=Raoultella terrigena TaxID=577 RepID=A0A4U9D2D0_RAOTE|nr:PTS-dependent dihydroxyacetone kinase, ADP-binding subunit dhaL [Raoultella terrigena]
MSLNRTQIVNWLYRCGEIFTKERDFLTGLDKEIGDADHGLNMHRGFGKVVEKLPSIADKDIGFILKNTGMTLLSNVGGASGPLFGTFFIRAAQVTQAHQSLSLDELYQMMREGADGVVNRGKAEPGDKTMCDVWLPVVEIIAPFQRAASADAGRAGRRLQAGGDRHPLHHHHAGPQRAAPATRRAQHRASGSGRDLGDVYDSGAGCRSQRVRKSDGKPGDCVS